MVQFNTDYFHSLDRDYIRNEFSDTEKNVSGTISIGDIGTSVGERMTATGQMSQGGGGGAVEAFQYGIRQGAKSVEIGMNMENIGVGPHSYGEEQREEIKKLSEINDTHISSIHAPTDIGNLSGRGENGYNEQLRKMQLDEIKKSIQFAADVTTGKKQTGVVIHTGEFARPFEEAGEEKGLFTSKMQKYSEEGEGAYGKLSTSPVKSIVDARTGQITAQIRQDETFRIYEGFDEKTGRAKFSEKKWADFEKLARENPQKYKTPEDAWLKKTHLEEQKDSIKINRNYQDIYWSEQIKSYEKQERIAEHFSKNEHELINEAKATGGPSAELEMKNRIEEAKKNLPELKKARKTYEDHRKEALKKADLDLEKFEEQSQYLISEQDYALKKSLDSFSQLGIEAMRASNQKNIEDGKGVYVAPENIFPQMGYGSHPDELISLVNQSRDMMAQKLMQQGYNREQAKKESKEHIKATFDTEHMGMWFQHFKRDNPNLSEADRRNEFNKWFMKQVEKLEKSDVLGHVHIADSLGYGHGNMVAGEGMLPLKDAIEYLKKKGYSGTMMSEGYGSGARQLTDAWRYFDSKLASTPSNAYLADTGNPSFRNAQYMSARHSQPPSYLFGNMTIGSQSGWMKEREVLWSESPLE